MDLNNNRSEDFQHNERVGSVSSTSYCDESKSKRVYENHATANR